MATTLGHGAEKHLDHSPIMAVSYAMPKELKLVKLYCKRCEEGKKGWYPRSPKLPVKCPKCQSPYWNKDRVNTIKKEPSIQ